MEDIIKIIVKGKEEDCYAFAQECDYDDEDVDYEYETEECFNFCFSCVGFYDYDVNDLQELSKKYNVEVMCNSYDSSETIKVAYYRHYKNGKLVESEIPIDVAEFGEDFQMYYDSAGNAISELMWKKSDITQNGNTFRFEDGRIYLNDVFSAELPSEKICFSDVEDEYCIETLTGDDYDGYAVIQFKFSTREESEKEIYTILDNDECKIICYNMCISNDFTSIESMWEEYFKIFKFKVIIDSVEYYITAGFHETSIADTTIILKEILNSIVIYKNNKEIKIKTVDNKKINSIVDSLLDNE